MVNLIKTLILLGIPMLVGGVLGDPLTASVVGLMVALMIVPAEMFEIWARQRKLERQPDPPVQEELICSEVALPFGSTLVRTLEEYQGPVLRQYEGLKGEVLLEKCCVLGQGQVLKSFLVRSSQAEVDKYLDGKVSMRDLLLEGDHKHTYFLVFWDHGCPASVTSVPAETMYTDLYMFLPDPTVFHAVVNRPIDDISIN